MIIVQTFIVIPVRLLRWIELIMWVWLRLTTSEAAITARQMFAGPLAPLCPDYNLLVPAVSFVLTIVAIYWVIAPIIVPFAALFFVGFYFMLKYQAIYVFESPFDTGGRFFYPMYRFAMASLLTSSVLNITFVFLKDGFIQAPLMLPLPFIVYFAWDRIDLSYRYVSEQVAFSRAVDVDNTNRDVTLEQTFDPKYFSQPVFKVAPVAEPYPHRKGNPPIPLVTKDGQVTPMYWEDALFFLVT